MIRIKALLTLGAVLFAASNAAADDSKNYAGLECERLWGGSISYTGWGAVANASSSSTLFVECPGVKDATSIGSGYARVKDRHATLDVECSLTVNYTSGSSFVSFADTDSSDNSPDSWQKLFYSSLGESNTESYYVLTCGIPPMSGTNMSSIAMYNILEF